MTITAPPAPRPSPGPSAPLRSLDGSGVSRSRRLRNGLATALIYGAILVAAVPLAFVLYYVVRKGATVFGLEFLTEDIPTSSRRPGPGMGPAVVGTILITGAATLMAVPLGILAAVYLNEYGRNNRLAGAMRSTEAVLRLVPRELREASTALGARNSRTILTVVIPAALPGITSGCLLAVARAAGETAPLLFTIGTARRINTSLLEGTNTALSAQIFRNAQFPFPGAQDRAWGAALTLILLVVLLTLIARVISARFTVR